MGVILDTVIRYFDSAEWAFTMHPEQPILQMGFQGDNGQWNCFAQTSEDNERFAFYSICPVTTPEDKRSLMAEFIARANYGLIIGNFELDFEDGEVRYKTSIDVEGDRITEALVQQQVYANIATMDNYLPGIMKLIYGDSSPAETIELIETQIRENAEKEE